MFPGALNKLALIVPFLDGSVMISVRTIYTDLNCECLMVTSVGKVTHVYDALEAPWLCSPEEADPGSANKSGVDSAAVRVRSSVSIAFVTQLDCVIPCLVLSASKSSKANW